MKTLPRSRAFYDVRLSAEDMDRILGALVTRRVAILEDPARQHNPATLVEARALAELWYDLKRMK